MRTGRKNRLLTIQQPVTTASNTGSRSVAWETFIEVWGYIEDRVRGAKEATASSVLYPMHSVDWIIRYTPGITPAMRVSYDGQVWEIIGVLNVDNRRAEMRLSCELRGNGAATSGLTCLPATYRNGSTPSFEQQIASGAVYTAPAITVTDVNGTTRSVLPNINITAIWSAITGRNTDGVEFFDLAAYPAGGAVVLADIEVEDDGGLIGSFPQPTGIVIVGAVDSVAVDDTTGEMTITNEGGACLPAVYSNGGAFSQQIASGATYTAPEIEVTDVDGVVRNVLPNIGVTCAWSAIQPKSSDGAVNTGAAATVYPAGGIILTGDQRVRDQSNTIVASPVAWRRDLRIMNADVASVVTSGIATEITVVLPPPPTPSGIAYKAVAPMSMLPITTGAGDSRALFISGWYDRTNPVYPVSYAEIDSAATQADVRGVAATGTSLTDSVIHTVLKHNNAFGNKLRFTDSLGNASDATVGSDLYAHVNWVGHSWTGATPYYVIDHLTGDGYMVKYVIDSGVYNLTNTSVGKSWADWMTAIPLLSLAGFTDWKPLDCCSLRPHINKANLFESWADNFFISSRAPGEIAGQTDNRVGFVTGENANTLNFNGLYDSGNASTILALNKATSGGFQQVIANVFPIRRHY